MSEVSESTEIPKETNDDAAALRTSRERVETTVDENTDGARSSANDDVQRAIEGLAEIPDDQLQEFFDDKDFMKGLDVVDAWEGDAGSPSGSRVQRNRDRDRARSPRERPRRDRRRSHSRDRPRREEKKREDLRRDPSKSSKDIERDKMRTKKDTARKILAEKEKAIKNLLDSDNVVPPGTEVEVIQDITDKQQNSERCGGAAKSRRSRERRRSQDRRSGFSPSRKRSGDRFRSSPNRRISDDRRQLRVTPERRRSWERRASRERSLERHRRREERELRLAARRSRSRDRQRSRSVDRYRKRWSRSPNGRRLSPRRHSRSRTPDRRTRKRSPFINEIARQFGKEGLIPGGQTSEFLPGIPPLVNPPFSQEQVTPVPPPTPIQQFMHHTGAPGPSMHMQLPGGQPYANFNLGPSMSFEPVPGPLLHPPQHDYSAAPIMYNQGNPPAIASTMFSMPLNSPQPVPAPSINEIGLAMNFNQNRCASNVPPEVSLPQQHHRSDVTGRRAKSPKSSSVSYNEPGPNSSTYSDAETRRPKRVKTPEPPVISNPKPFEKTSLSSLLEASVSAKDSYTVPVLYPGFKPEILRQCELALRDLPPEDLRLKVKGRFFFDPRKKDREHEPTDSGSNSILLRVGRTRVLWEENETRSHCGTDTLSRSIVKTHQKICQTEEIERECKAVQASIVPKTAEFCQQVYPNDLQQAVKEEKRPIMDRLDWDVRESYDYTPKIREADDLRWSLSNSSQKQRPAWNRGSSPVNALKDNGRLSSSPHVQLELGATRAMNVGVATRSTRDSYAFEHHRSSSREHYSRDRFSPTYRRSIERQEDFHDARSNHSRGESPMALEESPDEIEVLDDEHYSRGPSDWRPRGGTSFPPTSALQKLRNLRGRSSGRPNRARGGFRGKF